MLQIIFGIGNEYYHKLTLEETEDLPEGLRFITVDGQLAEDSDRHTFENLAKMLNRKTTKIRTVTLQNIFFVSPEFLAALVSIATKAEMLNLTDVAWGDPGFAILMTSLMQSNGIEDLSLVDCGNFPELTIQQMSMLFEGIAYSTSLDHLTLLRLPFGPHNDEAGRQFIHALRRNRNLKHLELQMDPFSDGLMISNILRAALLETKVTAFDYTQNDIPGMIPLHIFDDLICRDDCSLETLYLHRISIHPPSSKLPARIVKNLSLKALIMTQNGMTSSMAAHIAEGFKSLEHLNICDNQISDLAPFDKLLLGDNAKLEVLVLFANPISEKDFLVFLEKLPEMKSLRSLVLSGATFLESGVTALPFLQSKVCRDALLNALWLNTTLENVHCHDDDGQDDESEDDEEDDEEDQDGDDDAELFRALLAVPLSLNRGGRRELQNGSTKSFPRGLWALVLKRAMTLKYCSASDYWEDGPECTAMRVDVVYWLLREKVIF
ncbi:unnamed protein product [Cylindrotheca closterium]|uniref:Uncharacterized protein n=1 Tax=Cylindrotheca closterium TaxID=2856 RepID=A0AAD2G7R9_9STRA|nr:unnamed protein product [Cylindrotheca closterium]